MKRLFKIIVPLLVASFAVLSVAEAVRLPDGGGDELQAEYTALDTSSYGGILGVGLIPKRTHSLSNGLSGYWTGMNSNNMIKLQTFPGDLTEYDELRFSLYSPQKTKSQFAVVVRSPNSSEGACYFLSIHNIDWVGWKEFSLKLNSLEDFTVTRTPNWSNITQVYFQSDGFTLPDPEDGTSLYFDDVTFVRQSQGRTFGTAETNRLKNAAADAIAVYNGSSQIMYKGNVVTTENGEQPRYTDGKTWVNTSFIKKYIQTKGLTKLKSIASSTDVDNVTYYPLDAVAQTLSLPYTVNGGLAVVSLKSNGNLSAFDDDRTAYIAKYKLSYTRINDDKAARDIPTVKFRLKQRLIGGETATGTVFANSDWIVEKALEAKKLSDDLTKELSKGDYTRYSLWDGTVSTDECILRSYKNIRTMALAYNLSGTECYKNEELLNSIRNALDWMYNNKYGEKATKSNYTGNGWNWCVGGPLDLTDTLILMDDVFTDEEIAKYLVPVKHFSALAQGEFSDELNRQWLYRIKLMTALLEEDIAGICDIRDNCLADIKYVTDGDGFRKDGSYIANQSTPYNFGYGSNTLFAAVKNMVALYGTEFEITDPNKDVVSELLTDVYPKMFFDGRAMAAFGGEGMGTFDEYEMTGAYLACMIDLSEMLNDSIVKSIIKTYANAAGDNIILSPYYQTRLNAIAENQNIEEYNAVGSAVFNCIDRVVHHGNDFAACISMSSDTTERYAALDGSNTKGWYTGDGALYLYTLGSQGFDSEFYKNADMTKIPGTTEIDTERDEEVFPKHGALLAKNAFAGAVALDESGFAAMDFGGYSSDGADGSNIFRSDLKAKKAYLTVGNKIICMGADISYSGDGAVKTCIDNTTANILYSTEDIVVFDGYAGYCFADDTSYETQSRDAYTVVSVNHGEKPSGKSYVYTILPNASAEECEEFTGNSDLKIISNTSDIQAAEYNGYTAVAFYKPGSACGIETNIPLMLIRHNGRISVYEPTSTHKTARITVDGKKYDVSFDADGYAQFNEVA